MNRGAITSLIHCPSCNLMIEIYPSWESVRCSKCKKQINLKIDFLVKEENNEKPDLPNFFNFEIERVVKVLKELSYLFDCSLSYAWKNYMHDLIKEQFTLRDIFNYLEDMHIIKIVEERTNNDNGVRYSLDDLKKEVE